MQNPLISIASSSQSVNSCSQAVHIIRTLDEQVKTILETDKAADIAAITDMVCEGPNMPYLKENPLFRGTIPAHCLSCSDFPDK